jgi:gluconokinase
MLAMALDVGTSSARARCFDDRGRPLPGAEARAAYEPATGPDGRVELSADALLDAVATVVDGCLARAGKQAHRIGAVGASVFWHGLLGLDANGRPLMPVMTWADTRSARAAHAVRRELDEVATHRRTGAPIHAAYFPAKLRWLREHDPRTFARARRWCGFGEYLASRFTGEMRASLSMASGTGLLDQERATWDAEMLGVTGIDSSTLPPIDDGAAPGLVAPYAGRWPALARVPWFPAWGDGACSSVGSDCVGPDRVALNVGTSAALRLVATTVPVLPPGLWRYRVDARRNLVGGATSEGGNVLAWGRRTLAVPADDAALEQALAALPADGAGLTALPFLAGERAPGWREDARAGVVGLSLGTMPVEILRALLEAVAFRLAEIHERLRPLVAPDHTVVASGGALLHSPTWARIVADALGVPLALSSEAEASSRGAALMALDRLGMTPPPAPLGAVIPFDQRRHEIYRLARARQHRLYESIVGPRPA